jgi:methionyl-tRNA formyltransferase
VVFLGTPGFAVPSLQALLGSRHSVIAVVTQPDRPSGRGRLLATPPVKSLAMEAAVPILQPATMKDEAVAARMRDLNCDLGVVVAYGRILPDAVLGATSLGFVNVHASLLPRHRGAAPIHHAVMSGDATTGVTIMRVVRELDSGPIFLQASRPIGPEETSEVIERDLAELGARLLIDTIDRLADGTAVETEQDHSRATYAPRLTRADGLIDWTASAQHVHDKVRGLHPWPYAHTFLRGARWTVRRTDLPARIQGADADGGRIIRVSSDGIEVVAGDGNTVRILEVQLDSRRAMPAREFLAGHEVTPGDRLGTAA